MGEHDALRPAGRPGRVDDRVGIVGPTRSQRRSSTARSHRLGRRDEVVECEHVPVGRSIEIAVSSRFSPPRTAAIFATWSASSQMTDPRLGVAGHPFALLGRVAGIHRHDDAAGARDRETGQRPLRPGVGQDADAVARLKPVSDEPECQLVDELADLGERLGAPSLVGPVAERGTVAIAPRRRGRRRGDRLNGRWQFLAVHPGLSLTVSPTLAQIVVRPGSRRIRRTCLGNAANYWRYSSAPGGGARFEQLKISACSGRRSQ